jgi:hypothetical protein
MLPLVGTLLAVPAVVFLVLYFVLGRRAMAAGVVTAIAGAAAGAFFASAGSAMATSVDPNDAMLRGAAIGFVASGVVAVVIAFVLRLLRL